MNRAIFNYLPNISTPFELIDAIRQEPSLIFVALGYCNEDVLNDAEIVCFETKLNIPKVDASDLNEALNITSLKYDNIHFFEFDGMTFPSIKKETFDVWVAEDKQKYVNQLIDALILSKVEIKKLSIWSLSNLSAITLLDHSDMIDPGLSNVSYFNGRGSSENVFEIISFEPKMMESEVYFSFDDQQALVPNILVNLPESIVFETDDFSLISSDDAQDESEIAVENNIEDENGGFYRDDYDEDSLDDDENNFLDNWDLI